MKTEAINFDIVTAHNRIRVHRQDSLVELYSSDNALQSVVDLKSPHRLRLRNLEYMMAVLLFIPPPEKILILGTAGGSLVHYLRHYFADARITALDIDSELVEKMLAMQVLPQPDQRLKYVFDDAASFIAGCDRSYDLVLVDIFSGAQSPRWLFDRHCTDRLQALLDRNGAIAYNLLIGSDHDFRLFYRGLRLVFERKTLCLPVSGLENTIAFGIRDPLPARDMEWYLGHAGALSSRLGIDFLPILSAIYNTNPVGQGIL